MKKSKSKFDFELFKDEWQSWIVVSKQKHSKKQAIEIWKRETGQDDNAKFVIQEGFVRHGYGLNEEDERQNNWWLEFDGSKNSVPVYAIRNKELNEDK